MNFGSLALSILLSGVTGTCCYLIAGNSLDLFIGGLFFAAILAPPLAAIGSQYAVILGISLGFGFCWWMPIRADAVTLSQWAMCMAILVTFAGALVTAARAIESSAAVTIAALAWLTWPFWLCESIAGSQLHWSILFHPLFAINHVVSDLGIWTEQQGAYGLTNLGQDVPYQLPFSAWPVVALQAGIAISLSIWPKRRQTKNTTAVE